jgi:hypothetical protein
MRLVSDAPCSVIEPSPSTAVSVHCRPSNFTSMATQSPSMRPASALPLRRVEAKTKLSPIDSPRGGASIERSPPLACTLASVSVLAAGASWPVAGSAVAAATAAPAASVVSSIFMTSSR